MSFALSKSCITISFSLKSTTVIWQSSCNVGVCGLPPFSFEGSSPGSCPGCQFGRSGVTSTVLKVREVLTRVCRRLRMGETGIFETSGSERMEEARPGCSVLW
jgi:hypothetical protein